MKILIGSIMLLLSSVTFAIPMSLGDITGNGLHTETDTGDERFMLTDTSGVLDDATVFLMFEMAGNHGINAFGIYDDSASLEVFAGSISPLSAATLNWDTGTDMVTLVGSGISATIDETNFGFYLDTVDGRFFSESTLNGGFDYMQSFNVGDSGYADLLGANMVLAFEDLADYHTDYDYNDMVIGISDINPVGPTTQSVPEPMPLALMGLGLVGLGMVKRRKQ